VRTAEGTTSDSIVYVFGCCVFYREGDDGDSGHRQSAVTQSINLLCTLHGASSLWTEQTSWLYVKRTGPTQPVAFGNVLNTVACLHAYYFIHYSCSQTATTTSMQKQQAVTQDSTDTIECKASIGLQPTITQRLAQVE